jgi:hypothetical protein
VPRKRNPEWELAQGTDADDLVQSVFPLCHEHWHFTFALWLVDLARYFQE